MKEFKKVNKTFIKSSNSTTKIFNRYLYCLIPFLLLIILYNLIWGSNIVIINLLKNTFVSIITCLVVGYIFNLMKKDSSLSKLMFKDNILAIAIIIGLFSQDISLVVVIIASIISVIVRYMLKNSTISSSLYGILIILIASYFSNDLDTPLSNLKHLSYIGDYDSVVKYYGSVLSYSLGLNYYLSPVLSIIAFIYLFCKKSIKYNIVFSYVITFSVIMLFFGLFNGMNIWYLFFQLCTGNILFLIVFCLTDYPNTPITFEGQVIYGIALGILTSILRFIVPELSVVISLIMGPLLLTKTVDKMSIKLKNNKKFYYLVLFINIFLVIITEVIINIVI